MARGRGTPLIPMAFSAKDYGADVGGTAPTLRAMPHDRSHANAGGQVAIAVPDTLLYNGISHASAQETNTGKILRVLRKEIGEEAFAEWGLGVLNPLQPPQILQPDLYGEGVRCEASKGRPGLDDSTSPRSQDLPKGAVREVRQADGFGCPPQGRELPEQFSSELRAHLSKLPHPSSSKAELLFGLWQASEGIGVLRQALSAIQEVWRPVHVQAQPAQPTYAVRRLTPKETERLMGFPDDWTLIPRKNGKLAADSPRYKAIGNSWAVPVARWMDRTKNSCSRGYHQCLIIPASRLTSQNWNNGSLGGASPAPTARQSCSARPLAHAPASLRTQPTHRHGQALR
jgi:hypothetical protein